MPLPINDVDNLKSYIEGVMSRANHHADNVNAISLALAGAVVWRKDDNPIEVMAHGSEMKNVLWVRIGGQRYAFSYNHNNETIEMRKGTTQGDVLHSFSNATPLTDVVEIFRDL